MNNLKICVEPQKNSNSQWNIDKKQKNKAEDTIPPNSKLCYKAAGIKTVWYWCRNRYLKQQYSIENPEINARIYSQLIHGKVGKNIQWAKDSLFKKWCWENWTAKCKNMKLGHYLTPYTKINSEWIKCLKVRSETTKFLEPISSKFLCSDLLAITFWIWHQKQQKAKINK